MLVTYLQEIDDQEVAQLLKSEDDRKSTWEIRIARMLVSLASNELTNIEITPINCRICPLNEGKSKRNFKGCMKKS